MIKQLKIGDKEYTLSSSVFTVIQYDSIFGKDIYKDMVSLVNSVSALNILNSDNREDNKEDISKILLNLDFTEMIKVLTRMLYILALPNFEEEMSYDRFVQIMPFDFFMRTESIIQVTEIIQTLIPSQESNNGVPVIKR